MIVVSILTRVGKGSSPLNYTLNIPIILPTVPLSHYIHYTPDYPDLFDLGRPTKDREENYDTVNKNTG